MHEVSASSLSPYPIPYLSPETDKWNLKSKWLDRQAGLKEVTWRQAREGRFKEQVRQEVRMQCTAMLEDKAGPPRRMLKSGLTKPFWYGASAQAACGALAAAAHGQLCCSCVYEGTCVYM